MTPPVKPLHVAPPTNEPAEAGKGERAGCESICDPAVTSGFDDNVARAIQKHLDDKSSLFRRDIFSGPDVGGLRPPVLPDPPRDSRPDDSAATGNGGPTTTEGRKV